MRDNSFETRIAGEDLFLIGEKALYWPNQELLVVSDLHLGKAGHFRKHGIPISSEIHLNDLDRLTFLLESFPTNKLVFLGDLFHSDFNSEWKDFTSWVSQYPDVQVILVKGNHDILPEKHYLSDNLEVMDELKLKPFSFTHEKMDSEFYNISGHIHPCVRLTGRGKQGIRIPCFYFSKKHALLPAFGNFTGSHAIRPKPEDRVFGVINQTVINLGNKNSAIFS